MWGLKIKKEMLSQRRDFLEDIGREVEALHDEDDNIGFIE